MTIDILYIVIIPRHSEKGKSLLLGVRGLDEPRVINRKLVRLSLELGGNSCENEARIASRRVHARQRSRKGPPPV